MALALSRYFEVMAELNALQETEGITDYHEKFELICGDIAFSEPYLVSVYLAGLQPETQRNVRMFRPKSIRHCLLIGRLYESAHPCKPKEAVEELKSSVMVCHDAPASPAYQVFDEMLEPITDSEMSLNSPELLASMNESSDISVFFEARESDEKGGMVPLRSPEEVHHQTEVQVASYDTPIFPSKIAISALLCPSSSRTRTTNFHLEDPLDLESIISDSLSIYEAHSTIKTGKNELLCADEAFTVISTLDGVSPFLKVTPCFLVPSFVNLKAVHKEAAIRSSNASAEQMMSSPDFVLSPSAYYMFDEMPSRELQLFPCSCKLMDDLMGGVGLYNVVLDSYTFVFDPGKPMADWLIAPKSAVFIVFDAWLCTFGISIWSFKHDFSQFFVFDPGIACTVVHCEDENAPNQPAMIIFHLGICTLLSISMILSFQPQGAAASTCLYWEFLLLLVGIGLGQYREWALSTRVCCCICGIWSRKRDSALFAISKAQEKHSMVLPVDFSVA